MKTLQVYAYTKVSGFTCAEYLDTPLFHSHSAANAAGNPSERIVINNGIVNSYTNMELQDCLVIARENIPTWMKPDILYKCTLVNPDSKDRFLI